MATIGFIGSGNIGSTVAQLAVNAGHDVVMSNSRGPDTLDDLVAGLGEHARASTPEEAATVGDIVVVTIPLGKYESVPVQPLAGKIVIDTCNYYPERDGAIAALDEDRTTTSELIQRHLPTSHVVKAFNNIYSEHLGMNQRPEGAPDRTTLLIAGDDDGAKRTVTSFINSIGYDVYDTGSLADSWRFQRDQAAYAGAYAEDGDFDKPKIGVGPAELQTLLELGDRSIR